MNGIGPIYDLLSTGPGTFVYHLLILLAFEATAGIALIEYRHTRNPDQYRILLASGILFLVRIPLLFGGPLQSAVLNPLLDAVVPLLAYALEVASLALMWWAFLSPLVGRRTGRVFLIGNLLAAAGLALVFVPFWYRMLVSVPFFEYAAFWQQSVWDLWATLIPLSATVLLILYRERLGYILPAIAFGVMTLGNSLTLFNQVGLGRLVNLFGYPLLAVAAYRAALEDLWAYRQELETLSEESLRRTRRLSFLLEVNRILEESTSLRTALEWVARSVTEALEADRTALFLLDEDAEELRLVTQFVSLQRPSEEQPATQVALSEHSLLDHAVRRQRQLRLNPEKRPSRLQSLYELLGSPDEGPVIIQSLVRGQRVVGVLVVGNDHSDRAFGSSEARLCESVAPQIASAIECARLSCNLGHDH